MNQRYIRTAIVASLLAVVAILVTIAVMSSDTSQKTAQNSSISSVTPPPGAMHSPLGEVSVDLQDGLTGRLIIGGQIIPDDEIVSVESEGKYSFRPGKGKTFELFDAGVYTAEVLFWPADQSEPSTPESYIWSFRVTS